MNNLSTIGRILFALPFGLFGINHFIMHDHYIGMLTSFIPFGAYMVLTTGLCMIIACIAIISKKFIFTTSILLAVLLTLFILTIHIPHLINSSDPSSRVVSTITMLKDISLLGATLYIAGSEINQKNAQ